MLENLSQLVARLAGYSLIEIAIELALIWLVVYLVVRFLRGTRGAGILKGLALLLILGTLAIRILSQDGQSFQRLTYLYDRTLAFLAIALVVVFQPELRRVLIRLGETTFFRPRRSEIAPMIESVVEACQYNSKNRFGALIAIERSVGLGGLSEAGTRLDAMVSARLLQSIFWPNSALHDLGVLIREGRVFAAGVQFPLAETGPLQAHLGSRHRAGLGITEESDCISIIVSEESGEISVAERGRIFFDLSVEELRRFLCERLLQHDDGDEWSSRQLPRGDEAPDSAAPATMDDPDMDDPDKDARPQTGGSRPGEASAGREHDAPPDAAPTSARKKPDLMPQEVAPHTTAKPKT